MFCFWIETHSFLELSHNSKAPTYSFLTSGVGLFIYVLDPALTFYSYFVDHQFFDGLPNLIISW